MAQNQQQSDSGLRSDVPKYIINLDLPPRERWTAVVADYKHKFPKIQENLRSMIEELLGTFWRSVARKVLSGFMGTLNKFGVVYYDEELSSIAKQSSMPLGELVLMNLCYELFAACTSIISHDQDGIPIHARSMDWDLPALSKMTINVEFHRAGKPVFMATTWAGYVGILTGVRPQGYSVSINFRSTGDGF